MESMVKLAQTPVVEQSSLRGKKIIVTGGASFTRPHRPRARFFYTYVLESLKDKELYIGWSDDLFKRVRDYEDGKIFSTKHRLPIVLIYIRSLPT